MDAKEEQLLEAAATGDLHSITELIENGTDVNVQNKVNGWTALHWSCKRGYNEIVQMLLKSGADKLIKNNNNQTAGQLSNNESISLLLGEEYRSNALDGEKDLPITPNYIANPVFPYVKKLHNETQHNITKVNSGKGVENGSNFACPTCGYCAHPSPMMEDHNEIVLKVRIANSADKDFIEVELARDALTYDNLVRLCCEELFVKEVVKIRKLPNTILRKDKDVKRLVNFEEVEVVAGDERRGENAQQQQQSGADLTGSCISPFKQHLNFY